MDWADIAWSGDGLSVNDDGTASFVIGDDTSPTFTVTNTVLKLTGTFGVAKKVDGDLDVNSPQLADVSYTVTASWPAGPGLDACSITGVLDADNGFAADSGIYLPTGTVVTLSEATPSGTPDDVEWTDTTWSGSGLTIHDNGTASFVIGDGTSPTFTVTNTAKKLTGTFGVSKEFSGDFDASSPEMAGVTFTVQAAWLPAPGLKGGTVSIKLNAANKFAAQSGVQLPTGTKVTITELEPSGAPPDVSWGDATWSGEGITNNPNGTVSFVVGDGTFPQFTVTNATSKLTGTFIVAKKVGGDFNLFSPEVIDATYTVTASWPAAPGLKAGSVTLTLDQSNSFQSPAGVQLPTGTVVTLSEPKRVGAGPSVEWTGTTWAGEGSTLNDDGTASFVVGDSNDATQQFYAVNIAAELTGSVTLTKKVTGPGAGSVADGQTFTVTYLTNLADSPGPGTLTIAPGQTVSVSGLPVGTVVTLSEVEPVGGLSSAYEWTAPVFVLPDGTRSSPTLTFTVTAGQAIAVELDNPTVPVIPDTGFNAPQLTTTGLVLIFLGGLLLVVGSRRRWARRL